MSSKLFLYLITGYNSRKLTEQLSNIVSVSSVKQYSDLTGSYSQLLEICFSSHVNNSTIENVLQTHELLGHVSMPLTAHNHVTIISVLGITDGSCTKLIESCVSKIDGVNCIAVSLQHNEAFVEYNSQLTNIGQITTVICESGYDALPLTAITHHDVTNPSVNIVTIGLYGMVCMNCVNLIENTISRKSGVSVVRASLEQNNVVIEYNSLVVNEQQLKDAIENLGFEVTLFNQVGTIANDDDSNIVMDGLNSVSTICLGIAGMKCESCVKMIENGIMKVIDIHVSLEKKEAIVTFDSCHCSIKELQNNVYSLGFGVTYIQCEFSLLLTIKVNV